ncbi:MAG: HNH endonuclease [Actinobacteria bacterium]|nr:HNH endonuclease [Actinomycetota bacterium]
MGALQLVPSQDHTTSVRQSLRELLLLEVAMLNTEGLRRALKKLSEVQAWVDSFHVQLTRRLQEISAVSQAVLPEQVLTSASGMTRSDARRELQRVEVLNEFPQLESALQVGAVSSAHIDIVARNMNSWSSEERAHISQQSEWLANVAAHSTPDNFSRAMKQAVIRLSSHNELERLEQQRRKTWLRHWVDRDSGMVCMHGEFDPESGLSFVGKLQQVVDRLFHERTPSTCPDGEARARHLNALGLIALVHQATDGINHVSPHQRAEISVVIDYRTLIQQRQALEAMHPTCAIPQCQVPVGQCQPHHLTFWNSGGPTDLNNLIPLCATHHRCVHEGGWKLSLNTETRQVVVRQPGSNTLPP